MRSIVSMLLAESVKCPPRGGGLRIRPSLPSFAPQSRPSGPVAKTVMHPSGNRQQPLTLKVLLGVVLLFIPLVLIYRAWAYRLFSGKLDVSELIY